MKPSHRVLRIRGARTHNLKNVDLDLPRDALIVISGLSGSGKSSLAFDTIFAEGQRRYVESLSAYARQFLSVMDKPDVDLVEGLSPAIAIEQKSTSRNPRSTVGTITEVQDYLRLLFARAGSPTCPTHGGVLTAQTVTQMVDALLRLPEGQPTMLLAPVARAEKGDHAEQLARLRSEGYRRARIDGQLVELDALGPLAPRKVHDIDVVVDRFRVRADMSLRLAESLETALSLGDGIAIAAALPDDSPGTSPEPDAGTNAPTRARVRPSRATKQDRNVSPDDVVFSARHACTRCGYSIGALEPRAFSFNSPEGACPDCEGLGSQQSVVESRLVVDASRSIAAGAIVGWDKRAKYYFQMVEGLATHYAFDVDAPFESLPRRIRNRLLQGSGQEKIRFVHQIGKNDPPRSVTKIFEGMIPNLNRRYRETESATVREEIGQLMEITTCATCDGERLHAAARHVFVGEHNLPRLSALPIDDLSICLAHLHFDDERADVVAKIVDEIGNRLRFLIDVGLGYLSLDRPAASLSGGEAQRIRLASQIGAGLTGVLYVLDEPSIGLHQRDNDKLLATLLRLRDAGNTVIVVEHDQDAMLAADYLVDIGPAAGVHGGQIVAAGSPKSVMRQTSSPTGRYLSGRDRIEIPERRAPTGQALGVRGANGNNLRKVDVEFPIGLMTCVTGVSGSGKSTLVNDTLYRHVSHTLHNARHSLPPIDAIEGLDQLESVVEIDQSPIGRTPRSNPATYTGLFTIIRELFAGTPEARSRGYTSGRFSFNVKGGRCEACQGDGLIKVEMHFLPNVYVRCDSCQGRRYNRETRDIRYKGCSIDEILALSIEDALAFFGNVPKLRRKLETLESVGLSYLTLGQSATTLSGGEAQRIKLARELSKRDTGKTLYVLDEPTTGLHFADVKQLLAVLHRLRDNGNTVVVIEHNLDVIKTADWVIDMGPEGGEGGGQIIARGTPEKIARSKRSHTGRYLKAALDTQPPRKKVR